MGKKLLFFCRYILHYVQKVLIINTHILQHSPTNRVDKL